MGSEAKGQAQTPMSVTIPNEAPTPPRGCADVLSEVDALRAKVDGLEAQVRELTEQHASLIGLIRSQATLVAAVLSPDLAPTTGRARPASASALS